MVPVVSIDQLPRLPDRPRDGHKGTFGRVLVVAGSADYAGATILCGRAALRGGAGLVQVAVPAPIHQVVAQAEPCCITAALPATTDGTFSALALRPLLPLVEAADVVACGPGLGQGLGVSFLVEALLKSVAKPLVLDADGLNAWARLPHDAEGLGRQAPLICTPHPGEMRRLDPRVPLCREQQAAEFAQRRNCTVVLKGQATVVTDGKRLYRNTTGNPGMGTGGSGDVLTGLIAALLGQGLEPFSAAQLGVYLHGLAGDLAAERIGEVSLIATDLIDFLPEAFLRHRQEKIQGNS